MNLKIITLALTLPIFTLFSSGNALPFGDFKPQVNKDSICLKKISYENLYTEIVNQGIEYPEIVWAQAILESGHFKSKVFRQNNNPFGMKLPRRRETTAIRAKNSYALYESWQDAVKDYKFYQEYYFKNRTISKSSYYEHLDKKYSSAGGVYSNRLKSIILKNLKKIEYISFDFLSNGILGDGSSTSVAKTNL